MSHSHPSNSLKWRTQYFFLWQIGFFGGDGSLKNQVLGASRTVCHTPFLQMRLNLPRKIAEKPNAVYINPWGWSPASSFRPGCQPPTAKVGSCQIYWQQSQNPIPYNNIDAGNICNKTHYISPHMHIITVCTHIRKYNIDDDCNNDCYVEISQNRARNFGAKHQKAWK